MTSGAYQPPPGVTREQWDAVLAKRPASVAPDAWHRMMLASHRISTRDEALAQILYEQIGMLADHEGGPAPTWEDLKAEAGAPVPRGKRQKEFRAGCAMTLLEYRSRARDLLSIGDADALRQIAVLLTSRLKDIEESAR